MISRRHAALASGLALVGVHPLSQGQATTSVRRVGLLFNATESAAEPRIAALRQGMTVLGWIEGRNINYRVAFDSVVDRLDGVAATLIAQQLDVLVVGGSQAAIAAHRATRTVPIVLASISNPVALGLVSSLARPGGNVTGLSSLSVEVFGKLIEVMRDVVPGARRFAILVSENNPTHSAGWALAQQVCAALGLLALRVVASTPEQIGAIAGLVTAQGAHVVVVMLDSLYISERARLQQTLQSTRLPVGFAIRDHVDAGGLLSYATNNIAVFRNAAKFVDKILKGARPGDLPVEQPTTFELVINLKAAKALGITIPQSVLLRADEVIQ